MQILFKKIKLFSLLTFSNLLQSGSINNKNTDSVYSNVLFGSLTILLLNTKQSSDKRELLAVLKYSTYLMKFINKIHLKCVPIHFVARSQRLIKDTVKK